MPDISVIIVNWHSMEYVRRCLFSLQRYCSPFLYEIIVVDGGSFDGCGDMLAKDFPNVIFIQLLGNVGFGCANNAGFERATGSYIWFLNPDTELVCDAGTELRQVLETRRDAGLVGAKLLTLMELSKPLVSMRFLHHLIRLSFPNYCDVISASGECPRLAPDTDRWKSRPCAELV